MKSVAVRLTEANSSLASYAVPVQGTLARVIYEPEDSTRFPFQRDRDRIIHSQAFRRLKGKTQVFVAGEGDHYRTRLTHTMEVAQISRDIARTLSLNEDLAECIALSHDLGHPPFGHGGEAAIDAWMKQYGGGFEHNAQSLRIVTVLEEHSSQFSGLNLNREVLEGIQKHEQRMERDRAPSLEAQIVNIADEIAYTGHDCDDGLHAGLFATQEMENLPLVAQALQQARARGTSLRGALIHLLVTDLYAETERRLQTIRSLDDVYAAVDPLVGFSPAMERDLKHVRDFLWTRMYEHPRVREASRAGQEVLRALLDRSLAKPMEKILALQKKTGSDLPGAVKDYVAGMTDDFARMQLQ